MSVERLREAADVLRGLSRCGDPMEYPAPWRFVDATGMEADEVGIASMVRTTPEDGGDVTDWMDGGVARYIAAMNPAVGKALADWLDQIVETFEADPSDYCAGAGHDDSPCGSWWCENVDRALAVADAILGTP